MKNFKYISEIPFQYLKVGDKLISLLGSKGKIVALYPQDDNSIAVQWEHDTYRSVFYHDESKIVYNEQENNMVQV